MRHASSGEASSSLKAGGKGRERGFDSSSGSLVEEVFLGVVEAIPSDVVVSWLAGKEMEEGEAEGFESSFFLVGAGEKASPPPSTATRVPETGGAEIFGSLGALADWSGDLGRVFLFLLTIVRQRGGAKTTEKLSAKGDDSGKRKRRDGSHARCSHRVLPAGGPSQVTESTIECIKVPATQSNFLLSPPSQSRLFSLPSTFSFPFAFQFFDCVDSLAKSSLSRP